MHVVTSFINNGDGFIIDVSKAEVITCLKYELFRRRRLCYIATVVGWIRNVTMFWLVGLTFFFVVFSMVGTLVVAWMQHAYVQVVADAGSLAETKKLDHLVQEELNRALQEAMNVYSDVDPYSIVMGTEE